MSVMKGVDVEFSGGVTVKHTAIRRGRGESLVPVYGADLCQNCNRSIKINATLLKKIQ